MRNGIINIGLPSQLILFSRTSGDLDVSCSLGRKTNSLFAYDEPHTHSNATCEDIRYSLVSVTSISAPYPHTISNSSDAPYIPVLINDKLEQLTRTYVILLHVFLPFLCSFIDFSGLRRTDGGCDEHRTQLEQQNSLHMVRRTHQRPHILHIRSPLQRERRRNEKFMLRGSSEEYKW